MVKQAEKTNAMRLLDSRQVNYEAFTFSEDIHSGTGVAEALNVPAASVFKTLVVTRPKGRPLLVMMPSDHELDLKSLATILGEKKLEMASFRQAEALTGLLVGGISALSLMGRPFDVFLSAAALGHESVLVSAGRRGMNLKLAVRDLIEVTAARVIELGG